MVKVFVDLDKCNGDAICVDVCPVNVFDMVKMHEHDDEEKSQANRMEDCILCMACVVSCPTDAITIEEY